MRWKESLSLLCDEIADGAATSDHKIILRLERNPSSMLARRSLSVSAGRATQALCVLSWNAGHLGQQQWSEVKSWLSTEASQTCDVLVLQETHWQATAEFTASGWYCVSSASPDDTLKANKTKKGRGGTAR